MNNNRRIAVVHTMMEMHYWVCAPNQTRTHCACGWSFGLGGDDGDVALDWHIAGSIVAGLNFGDVG